MCSGGGIQAGAQRIAQCGLGVGVGQGLVVLVGDLEHVLGALAERGDTRIVHAQSLPAQHLRHVVSAHAFDTLYHEIFNEVERETVFAQLKTWLDARF